jgi:hypothetical protein
MVIERTSKEYIIKLPLNIDINDIQNFLNFARYKEITANFNVSQAQVDELVSDIKKEWNENNKKK